MIAWILTLTNTLKKEPEFKVLGVHIGIKATQTAFQSAVEQAKNQFRNPTRTIQGGVYCNICDASDPFHSITIKGEPFDLNVENEAYFNGMQLSRAIASTLLEDSALAGDEYYKKEDDYVRIINRFLI